MGLRLNFIAILVVLGLMLSSAAAQQPPKKPKELETLGQYVGDWTSDVTSKPAVWTPEEKKFRTSNHAEFVLDGKFLQHIEVNHVVGDPEKVTKALWFQTFDPQAERFVMWFFQSTGVIGKANGIWNPNDKSFLFTPTDLSPNATGKHTEAFPNDHTITGSYLITETDGRTLFDMVWTRKRQAGVAGKPLREQWAEIGTPIQPIPAEVKRLKPLVGTWDSEYVFRVPQRPTAKGVITDEWALDGRFIMRRETVGDTDSIAMIGWDDNKRAYRIARAISNGRTNEAVGQWNDATRSFVWDWKVADSDGVSAIATWRLVGSDAIQLHVVHEKGNDVLLDLTIKMKRRK